MKLNYKHKRAFTLIELLIVIAIIGILFIVLVSKIDFATDKAKASGVQTDFRSFQVAFEMVSKENAGFNTFGWDTGDNAGAAPSGYTYTNADKDAGDRIRNSYDEGDTNLNGKYDDGEVWTGRKIYTENWTGCYTLINPGNASDISAIFDLQTAINKNLDPKLHINIADDGTISMANGLKDPWSTQYHGRYITNASADAAAKWNTDASMAGSTGDNMDRGAILMYSNGANQKFGTKVKIVGGVVTATVSQIDANTPDNNKMGADDYVLAVVYTYTNGYGETGAITEGFSNNLTFLTGNGGGVSNDVTPGGNGGTSPDPSEPLPPTQTTSPWEEQVAGLYESGGTYTNQIYTWDEMKSMGWINNFDSAADGFEDKFVGDMIFPSNLWSAAAYFGDCNGLTGVVFQEGITYIGEDMFKNCTNINHIVLPKSLQVCGEFGEDLSSVANVYFAGTLSDYLKINWGTYSVSFSSPNVKIYINKNELLTDIVVPSDISTIPYGLFERYRHLNSVVIPSHVTVCGTAFAQSSVKQLVIEGNITESLTFAYCDLEDVYINNNITGGQSFTNSAIDRLHIGSNVRKLGSWAFFSSSESVSEVWYEGSINEWLQMEFESTWDSPIANFSTRLFIDEQFISDLIIPDNVTKINPYVFYGYSYLTSIKFGANVKEIGDYAFYRAINVTSITFNEGLKNIGPCAFGDLTKVKTLTLPDSLETIQPAAFNNMYGVTSLHLGQNLKTIGDNAFYNLSITSLVIPDSVVKIGERAFNDCTEIRELIIGSGVTSIGLEAFRDLSDYYLTTVYINAIAPPTMNNAFMGCNVLALIIVPDGSLDTYKSAAGWSDYADKIIID